MGRIWSFRNEFIGRRIRRRERIPAGEILDVATTELFPIVVLEDDPG